MGTKIVTCMSRAEASWQNSVDPPSSRLTLNPIELAASYSASFAVDYTAAEIVLQVVHSVLRESRGAGVQRTRRDRLWHQKRLRRRPNIPGSSGTTTAPANEAEDTVISRLAKSVAGGHEEDVWVFWHTISRAWALFSCCYKVFISESHYLHFRAFRRPGPSRHRFCPFCEIQAYPRLCIHGSCVVGGGDYQSSVEPTLLALLCARFGAPLPPRWRTRIVVTSWS